MTACRDAAKDFPANAGAVAGLLGEQLSNRKNRHLAVHFLNEFDKDLIESTMYAAYGACGHPVSKKLAELIGERLENKGLGISNLGRHEFGGYENIHVLDVRFIGPAFPANMLTVDLLTANGVLNVCLRYNKGETGAETVEAIYNRAVELLK